MCSAAFSEGHNGGFRLRDNLSFEVSVQSDDPVDLSDVAGSGSTRLNINSGWDTLSVKAVGELSLPELLSWRGYIEWYGVFDDREAWDAGVAVQMSV